MTTFVDFLRRELEAFGGADAYGAKARFAKIHGLDTGNLTRWLNGQPPSWEAGVGLIQACGGHWEKALPDWEPDLEVSGASAVAIGRVAASSARFALAEESVVSMDVQRFLGSTWASYTRAPASGRRVELVQVAGDSMEPVYPDGCFVAVRPPRDPRELPQGVHGIVRVVGTGEMTFKVLQFDKERKVVLGVPLNRSHEVGVWRMDEVEVDWVVLGWMAARVNEQRRLLLSDGASLAAEEAPGWTKPVE